MAAAQDNTVRPLKEVRDTILHESEGPALIDLRGNTYATIYRGEHETDPEKDILGIYFYSNKKGGKVNTRGRLIIDRKAWAAFKATGDLFFEFPSSLRLKSKKKPKPRTRSSDKKK